IFANDVAIELEMLAQPAALLFLVTETLRDGKSLQRFLEFPFMRRDDTRESGREFGTQRHFTFAFIGEIEKLRDDHRAAFFGVELRRFEDRSVPFDEAISAR